MIVAGMAEEVPPQVGELSIYISYWDWSDPKNTIERYEKLPSHPCTAVELGLENGDGDTPYLFPLAIGESDI